MRLRVAESYELVDRVAELLLGGDAHGRTLSVRLRERPPGSSSRADVSPRRRFGEPVRWLTPAISDKWHCRIGSQPSIWKGDGANRTGASLLTDFGGGAMMLSLRGRPGPNEPLAYMLRPMHMKALRVAVFARSSSRRPCDLSIATAMTLVLLGCSSGGRPDDLHARKLCLSPLTAKHIRDPYGIDYRLTVEGALTVSRAWNSTAGLLKGWPQPFPEGPAVDPHRNFWKTDLESKFIAVCYVHGHMTGQRGTVTASSQTFSDALIEVRDDHVAYLVTANGPHQGLHIQVPPNR